MRPCFMNVAEFDFLIVYVFDQSVFSVIISSFEMSMTMENNGKTLQLVLGVHFTYNSYFFTTLS